MLRIETEQSHGSYEYTWWVGHDLPPMGRFANFQADGHELQLLLLAMQRGYVGPGGRVALAEEPHGEGA
jgi:hypothetical protein